jgi:hypothetical protein
MIKFPVAAGYGGIVDADGTMILFVPASTATGIRRDSLVAELVNLLNSAAPQQHQAAPIAAGQLVHSAGPWHLVGQNVRSGTPTGRIIAEVMTVGQEETRGNGLILGAALCMRDTLEEIERVSSPDERGAFDRPWSDLLGDIKTAAGMALARSEGRVP